MEIASAPQTTLEDSSPDNNNNSSSSSSTTMAPDQLDQISYEELNEVMTNDQPTVSQTFLTVL